MKIAVIGGGAAGFMAAITAKSSDPESEVILFEKSDKVLSKVKISGGGRCNVTHACFSIAELTKQYPRGGSFLKKSFSHFYTKNTIDWFENRGVTLKTEQDNRMFPNSDSSQSIIDCLINQCDSLGIKICYKSSVKNISPHLEEYILVINNQNIKADRVIIATGGSPKAQGFQWLMDIGYKIEIPVPSLFTFNMPNENIKELMGIVAHNTRVHIQGSKLKHTGPLLITHWGMSGPAILKASAWGARDLAQNNYLFNVQVNWANLNELDYLETIKQNKKSNRIIGNRNPFNLPNRLWSFLLDKVGVEADIYWNQLDKKRSNRLLNVLFNDTYQVNGKTTFKEEFVTCGGILLNQINPNTLESKIHQGIFFCGEILDIDGVTGGFNFQSAWTTGYLAGKNCTK